ncbi:hypothetical protein F4782DRAFT_444517 [Xylaria castorea]|nr:hypothetical protein F4782DRAFT_444517 [Xylaria castorea]
MGSVTIPAQPGETLDHTSAAGRHGPFGSAFAWLTLIFESEWLSVKPEADGGRSGGRNPGDGLTRAATLRDAFFSAAEGRAFPVAGDDSLFFRLIAAVEWFWAQDVPAPLVLLLLTCVVVFMHARSVRGFVQFWRQVVLFAAALVWKTPGMIVDLFFSNRVVDSPFPFWFVLFCRGFAGGVAGSLYEMFTGRRWVVAVAEPIPPPSPPPTPPRPLSPPPRPRPLRAYFDDDEEDDMIDRLYRAAYERDVQRRREWEQRLQDAMDTARGYNRARRDHEARAADRERRRERDDEETPETIDRMGREPRTLRGEFGYWWPWVRVALGGLTLVGIALGVEYYCVTLEAGEDCGWVTEVVCGGGGVGSWECLGYNDRPIREAIVGGQGPPRFRYLSDGSRIQIPDL